MLDGFVNVDFNPNTSPDVYHDLLVYPWPFDDNSADEIVSCHVLEHLIAQGDVVGFNNFFRECWRILKPHGKLNVVVPDANGGHAFSDPSHKSFYNKDIFAFISRDSIARNAKEGSKMTPVTIDYDFGISVLDVVNTDIRMEALAIK